ncbi:MAG: hypothetical protein M3R53_10065 [Candidatus Eremiobacteraeota bacterium]|nr:hypothetical protein [Candidatus Eremiobacteraeota bacterium]
MLSTLVLAALAAMPGRLGSATLPVAPVSAHADAFEKLMARWALVTDYVVTIDTLETKGAVSSRSMVRYSFRKPDRARLEVIDGNNRGGVVVWQGGAEATAYKRGIFSIAKIHADLSDKRIQSLRGNGVLTPDLTVALACFAAHRSDVHTEPGPVIAGERTETVELRYARFSCPMDSPIDADITRDVLRVSERTGAVIRRERYEGQSLVESYDLKDLMVNPGLGDDDFK